MRQAGNVFLSADTVTNRKKGRLKFLYSNGSLKRAHRELLRWQHVTPGCFQKTYLLYGKSCAPGPGLVQQTVQIVASLRSHDLTLVVGRHFWGYEYLTRTHSRNHIVPSSSSMQSICTKRSMTDVNWPLVSGGSE